MPTGLALDCVVKAKTPKEVVANLIASLKSFFLCKKLELLLTIATKAGFKSKAGRLRILHLSFLVTRKT